MTTAMQSIWVQAAIDLLAVFGEAIVYQPLNGESRSISAVINYDGIKKTDPMPQGHGPAMTISVLNHAANGITAVEVDTGGDVIVMPTRVGATAQSRRIIKIAAQDEGMITLEVR
jgi:hypothetical protein